MPWQALNIQAKAGEIKEGYIADFIIIDTNIESCGKISETKVLANIVDGKVRYIRNSNSQ